MALGLLTPLSLSHSTAPPILLGAAHTLLLSSLCGRRPLGGQIWQLRASGTPDPVATSLEHAAPAELGMEELCGSEDRMAQR
ncbi:hypothetical protein E2562_009281 [Oryza meyeriana var. granulata]|uniref:Uncharacterized protein n=1 Tax=Oryza meyeriana var. granulata TaxID=110450 RepID=A0A6G1E9T4_9ORYZ|nr:hypothetical protein E2562_009281 [Oryza meyeriana var. granulata]